MEHNRLIEERLLMTTMMFDFDIELKGQIGYLHFDYPKLKQIH